MTNKSNNNHIIFSYLFNKDGSSSRLDDQEISKELKNPNLAWVHLDANHKSTKKWLQKEVNYLDNLVIDALIAEETRPRLLKFEHGILLILRGIHQNNSNKNLEMVSVRMWIDNERIISIQKRSMNSIIEMEKIINSAGKIFNSGEFLCNFLNLTLSDINEFVYSTGEAIDKIEDAILSTQNMKYRYKIVNTRSQLTIYRRYLIPQKEAIMNLKTCQYQWINKYILRQFNESSDKIIHVIEEVDEVLMRTKILHDELSHALNERINCNMFKLSIIAMIFMPLTFITSLFGMNFQKIPWSENQNGFYIICLIMIIITAIQMILLKKKNLF